MFTYRRICLVPLFYAFLLSFLSACSEPPATSASAPVSVSVVVVEEVAVKPSREFVARTVASSRSDITARVEGEIKEVLFKEGSKVTEGQVLIRLEDTNVRADLRQAEAELTAARTELESATRNLQRGEEIAKDGFLSATDLDKLKDRVSAANSRLQAAESAVEKASSNLGYTEIKAPFGGWVGKLRFDVGSVVGPGSGPISEILVTDPLHVDFQINEAEYVIFRRGRTEGSDASSNRWLLQLILSDGSRFEHQGALDFADVSSDTSTGTVAMRAVFPNPEAILLPGLYVTLLVEGQTGAEKVLVPQIALQETIEGQFVLVVDDQQQVVQRFVQTGVRQGALLVIEQGLEPGERVIVEGLQKVRSGVVVKAEVKRIDIATGVLVPLNGDKP